MAIEQFQDEYRFLSNFYPAVVKFEGLTYPTVENAYQAAKTLDADSRRPFTFDSVKPGKAKRMGKRLGKRTDWEDVKIDVMHQLLVQKFAPETNLARMLADTHPHELIEGNFWNDTFWGVCRGKGKNWLGRLLMDVRTDLLG